MRSIVDAMLGLSQKTGFMKYSQRAGTCSCKREKQKSPNYAQHSGRYAWTEPKTGFMKYSQRDHKKRVRPRRSTEGKQSESDDFLLSFYFVQVRVLINAHNVLRLQEVGDFEALNCLPPMNLIRSTKLQLTTEPPISCRCCYGLVIVLKAFSLMNRTLLLR